MEDFEDRNRTLGGNVCRKFGTYIYFRRNLRIFKGIRRTSEDSNNVESKFRVHQRTVTQN